MSSVGQAVGGVVGAVVGFFTPLGPLYGAQIGMMAGGYLDPPKGPTIEGPRLDDLTVQTSTYGAVIPRLYGTIATAGNVFWLENNKLKEKVNKTKSGGKGGGSATTTKTYSYYATFAVGLCQGPIVGVRRLWIRDRLIYDAGSSDMSAIIASNQSASLFDIYTGTDAQLPDDRMQATLGIDATPAYRGLAYLVFKDLPLKDYGNSLLGAQVKAEVVAAGSVSEYTATAGYTPRTPSSYTSVVWKDNEFVTIDTNSGNVDSSPDGLNWSSRPTGVTGFGSDLIWNGKIFCSSSGYSCVVSEDAKTWVKYSPATNIQSSCLCWTGKMFIAPPYSGSSTFCSLSYDGKSWFLGGSLGYKTWSTILWCDTFAIAFRASSNTAAISKDGFSWSIQTTNTGTNGNIRAVWTGEKILAMATDTNSVSLSSDGINWESYPVPYNNYASVVWTGKEFYLPVRGSTKAYTSKDGKTWTERNVGVSEQWSRTAWNGAVILVLSSLNRCEVVRPYGIDPSGETLASVVRTEMLKSDILRESDIDVTALNQTIRGYKISALSALRSGIEPLQGAWPFDVIQSGYKIVCVPRGGSSVATITASDIDARAYSEPPGVSITLVREMDSVLPRRVALSYIDSDREYNTGSQYADRLGTDTINTKSIEMALVLTATEAGKIAEVLLYLYWMERYNVSFRLPSSYNHLEPSDVITILSDDGTYYLRLTEITYAQDGRLECQAKYHAAATYVSTAIGVSVPPTYQALAPTGYSSLALLDIPLLIDSTDQAGFVAALCGSDATWPGGVIVRTDDSGQTWTEVQSFSDQGSLIGVANTMISAGRTDVFDTANTLRVFFKHGSLSSVSELAVLNGENWFAYGSHGRWEIIAARTCAMQSDGSYLISDMLRGRRGTEWACGLHDIGDTVVLLDSSSVDFISASIDSIGKSRIYRGVTSGKDIGSAPDTEFTYAGVNLECLSPVYLNGFRHPTTNDWTLTWIRRTRVGGEWRDYVDATLGEASESYEVEIYSSNTYTTLKRTLTGLSSATATYTSANQVTDFGSNQATLYVKVYQLSANVGRGYPLTTSITR